MESSHDPVMRMWAETAGTPENVRYQLLVEEFELARQLSTLAGVRQATERAHNEKRISDEVFEERNHEIFARRIVAEERMAEIKRRLERAENRPVVVKPKREPASEAHEKELLNEELNAGLADTQLATLDQLLKYNGMIARLGEINTLQRRQLEQMIETARDDEQDDRLSSRRQQEARRQRERAEKALRDHIPKELEVLREKQMLIAERMRKRTKRQPLFIPLRHLYNEFDDVPVVRNQIVSHAPDVDNDLDTDDDEESLLDNN